MIKVSSLFRDSFNVYTKNFGLFFGYAAWLFIPLALSLILSTVVGGETMSAIDIALNGILYGLMMLWIGVVFIILVPKIYTGKKISTKNIGYDSLKFLFPYLSVSIVVGLITLIGYILLIVPGVIFSIWFAFAAIIVVLEKSKIFDSLSISKKLVKGRFWKVFWRLLAGGVIILAAYLALLLLLLFIYSLLTGTSMYILIDSPSYAQMVVDRIAEIVIVPFGVIYQVLLYLDLKKQ